MTSSSYRCLQIIGALASSDKPLEKAERCLEIHNHQPSRKRVRSNLEGHQKDQHWVIELIQVLCAEEPKIEDEKLIFVPKIVLLPIDVQRNILAFLVQHASDIPTINLDNLLSTLQSIQHPDEWCCFHIWTLQDILNQRTKTFCTQQQNRQDVSAEHKISNTSRDSFDNICKHLLDGSSCSTSSTTAVNRCKLKFDWLSEMVAQDSKSRLTNQSPLQKSNLTSLSHSDNDIFQQNQCTENKKRTSRHAEVGNQKPHLERSEASDVIPQDGLNLEDLFPVDNALVTEGVSNNDKISSDLVSQEEDNTVAHPAINDAVLQDTPSEEKPITGNSGIDVSLKSNLDLLKNELLTCSAESVLSETAQDTLKRILHSSVEVAEDLWGAVALENIPPVGLECLCQFVVQHIGPAELSYTAAFTMASKCFLNKLCDSANTVPRALASTLFNFAKAFPKPTIEGVVLPSIIRRNVAAVQCDLIAKLTKDVLTNEYRVYLLNGLLQSKELQWGEHHTSLVQNIFNNKLELDQKSLSLLVTSLGHHGTVHHSCKKFAKLLLFIINQYGKQMTKADINSVQSLVAANQTFLKKAALNALKKFQH